MTAQDYQVSLRFRQAFAVVLAVGSALAAFFASRELLLPDVGSHVLHVTHLAVAGAGLVVAGGLWKHTSSRALITWGLIAAILAFPLGRWVGTQIYRPSEAISEVLAFQLLLGVISSAAVFWILRRARSLGQYDEALDPEATESASGLSARHAEPGIEIEPPRAAPAYAAADGDRVRRARFSRSFGAMSGITAWGRRVLSPQVIGGFVAALVLVGFISLAASLFRSRENSQEVAGGFDSCDVTIRNGGWRISASTGSSSVGLDTLSGASSGNKFEHEGLGGSKSSSTPLFILYADNTRSLATSFFLEKDEKSIYHEDPNAFAIFNNKAQDEIVLRGRATSGLFLFPDAAKQLVDFAAQSGKPDERIQGVYFVNDKPVAQLFFSPAGLQASYKKALSEHERIARQHKDGACSGNMAAAAPAHRDAASKHEPAMPKSDENASTKKDVEVQPESSFRLTDFAELDALIADAQSGKNPKITASRADSPGEPLVLVRMNGKPAFAYVKSIAGANGLQTSFSMSCGPNGTIDMTRVLFNSDADKGSLPVDSKYEINLRYGASGNYLMPVKLVKQFTEDWRLFVRVQGSASANDPFFANLGPTTNFDAQLKKDGVFQPAYKGTDLSDFNTQLKPLIDTCRGIDPSLAGSADTARGLGTESDRAGGGRDETVNLYAGPTANQIRDALQREVAGRLARVDAMANQCDTFKQQNNPIGAVMCLMTGGGALSSKSIQISINSVTVDRCVVSENHEVYCRYSADTNVQGSGMAGQVASMFNTFLALEGWTYSSFLISNGRWEWLKTYSSCDFAGAKIECQWFERR